jgi:hypothetical protein
MSAPQKDGPQPGTIEEQLLVMSEWTLAPVADSSQDRCVRAALKEAAAEVARLRSLTEKPGEQRIEGHCGGWIAGWDRHIVFNPDDPDVQIPATGPATLLIHGAPPEQSEK